MEKSDKLNRLKSAIRSANPEVIDQEFQIAFEAFTVIENMYGKIEGDIEVILLDKINASLTDAGENKQHLLQGLLDIIPNIPLDQDPVDF